MSKSKEKPKGKEFEKMPIVNLHAAGIDVGSRSHFVAIGQDEDQVKEFGVYTEDLHELCKFLKEEGIATVALESTGSYWQPLFVLLQEYGLNPILVNGKFTKNVKGRKTDIQDCQWIQKMHALGLLEGSFIPDLFTEQVRQYYRHRQSLVDNAASYINKMQKALRLINIRLDVVLRDVMGRSGKDIIKAILNGERDAKKLASLAQPTVKAPISEIETALTGDWREEYIFELRQCYQLYKFYHERIDECDAKIEQLLKEEIIKRRQEEALPVVGKEIKIKKKKARKNEANIDLQRLAVELTGGIDISAVDGIGLGTILTIISEVGVNLKSSFPSAKQFASWLQLSPNLKKTGGRVFSSKTLKGKNRLARALMHAANSIGNMKKATPLVHFFKRIERRKSRVAAIVATARKLAVILWNMLVKKESYRPQATDDYLNKIRRSQIKQIQRKIRQLGISEDELVFSIA